jgi:hypothetical protein
MRFRGCSLIATVGAVAALATGCDGQSFEVGSNDLAPDPKDLPVGGTTSSTRDIPSSSSGSQSQPSNPGRGGTSSAGSSLPGGSPPTAGTGGVEMLAGAGGDYAEPGLATDVPLSTSGWIATASDSYPGSDPASVLDTKAPQTWRSGINQYVGMWFQIDMRSAQFFWSLDIDTSTSAGAAPALFDVYTSLDGTFQEPLRAGVMGSGAQRLVFQTPQRARYIRLVLALNETQWWAIDSIVVRQ